MIALVVREFTLKYELANRVVSLLVSGITILFLAVISVRTWDRTAAIRSRNTVVWIQKRNALLLAAATTSVSFVAILGVWLSGLLGLDLPWWTFLIPIGSLFATSLYTIRVYRQSKKPQIQAQRENDVTYGR